MKAIAIHQLKCVVILLAAVVLTAAASVAQSIGSHRIVPLRPMTGDVEVLYGDPDRAGEPFVIRIRELAGGIIPPHRHLVDEHLTVVQGTLYFAVGDEFDRGSLREMKAGSYAFIPKGSIMFGYTPDAAIVQVHGIGPFKIHWRTGSGWLEGLRTLESPDAMAVFKFRRGDRVVTPRGVGRIKQGYDSGEVIGYEIDGDDGALFMAEECEIESPKSLGTRAVEKPDARKCFSGAADTTGYGKSKHIAH